MAEKLNRSEATQSPESGLSPASCLRWAGFFLLLAALVAFCAGLLPLKPVVVATGSMEPAICVGDIALVLDTDPGALEAGDVIQYRCDGYTVVHRVVEVSGDGTFLTQGDSNNAPDANPVSGGQVIGRVVLVVPKIGKLTLWFHSLF